MTFATANFTTQQALENGRRERAKAIQNLIRYIFAGTAPAKNAQCQAPCA